LQGQLIAPGKRVTDHDGKVQVLHQGSGVGRRLAGVPGIGPITATALLASLGDGKSFGSARQVAARLGLAPKQASSGGKPKPLGVSKRGDVCLRTLLIHGARAAVTTAAKKDDSQSRWVDDPVKRRNHNIAAVAVANKDARVVWALLTKAGAYCEADTGSDGTRCPMIEIAAITATPTSCLSYFKATAKRPGRCFQKSAQPRGLRGRLLDRDGNTRKPIRARGDQSLNNSPGSWVRLR
jgi:hypothetical protein